MDSTAKLIEAIATLLWPVFAIVLALFFRQPLASVIKSWAWRKSTLKVGDLEISVDDYNQQQRDMVGDLQEKIVELESRLSDNSTTIQPSEMKIKSVLWVDDHPENHIQLIEQLKKNDITIVQELSTSDAMNSLSRNKFDLIITDMHRVESGKGRNEAGMDLISLVRQANYTTPIVLFFGRSKKPVIRYREIAVQAGANLVTASATELISAIEWPNKLSKRDAVIGAPS
jgi:CheY-like chemotaxis protein